MVLSGVSSTVQALLDCLRSYAPDLIYLCFPNNPTGAIVNKVQRQEWADYVNKVGAVIIYDAAYGAYISEPDVPHSIYECEGAMGTGPCRNERTGYLALGKYV